MLKRLTAALFAALLIAASAFAEDSPEGLIFDEDVEEEEISLDDPAGLLGWAEDVVFHSANENSPVKCSHPLCFWNMKMGLLDEEAVWEVLTQPLTVLDGHQRHQYNVKARPEADCEDYVGCVTFASQGVHVLDKGDQWTLIEAYSSSVEGSPVHVYAELFQGYVPTELLKEVPVDQTYGLVIDKQQQRLYLFREGKLYSTLLCSTGYADPKKKNWWNETPAGEFILISWTGDFTLEGENGISMKCRHAIRINDGILIHEVPKTVKPDGSESYWRCERYLGEKASHGCIRVQKNKTPEGINEEWMWKNLSDGTKKGKLFTKVIIWDDAGRELGYPDDGLELYYHKSKDPDHYHSSRECRQIRGSSRTIAFTYAELEDKAYKNLTACPYCAPQPRKSEIDIINQKNNR